MAVLSCAVLCVPFALVARAQAALAESALSIAVATLTRVTAPLAPSATSLAGAEDETAGWELEPIGSPEAVPVAAAPQSPKRRPARAVPLKPPALFVSAASVLQLSKSAARPRGSFVAETPQHPAGLRLLGVGSLGIGVQDGDILIEAMGITPRSSGEIIGGIIEARAQHARYLGGTLWRQGQTFRITVEQPYLDPA